MLKNIILIYTALAHIAMCRSYDAGAWAYALPGAVIVLCMISCFIKFERMKERGE